MATPSRGRVHPPTLAALIAATLLIGACSATPSASSSAAASEPAPSPGGGSGGGESDTAEPTPGTSLTACELVTPADIEAALTLDPGTVTDGTLEQQGTVLDPAINECAYTDESWGGLVVYVTPTDGVNAWDALATVYQIGESMNFGDAGLWFESDDRGFFLKGSVLIMLQFTFLTDGTPFRDPTIALGQVAVDKI